MRRLTGRPVESVPFPGARPLLLKTTFFYNKKRAGEIPALLTFFFSFFLLPSRKQPDDRTLSAGYHTRHLRKQMKQEQNHNRNDQRYAERSQREQECQKTENRTERINDQYRRPVAEAGRQNLIVDMLVIRHHDLLLVDEPAQDREQRIEHRNRKHDDRNDEAEQRHVLEQTDHRDDGHRIPEEQGPCIAHINRRRVEVMEQKADVRTDQHDTEVNNRDLRLDGKCHDGDTDQRYGRHAGSEAVEAVDQVDRVRNPDDPEERQEDTDRITERHHTDERYTEYVDLQSRENQDQRRDHLTDQLIERADLEAVVKQSRQDDDESADTDRQEIRYIRSRVQKPGRRTTEDRQPSHTGSDFFMYFSHFRIVHHLPLYSKLHDRKNQHITDGHGQKNSNGQVYINVHTNPH